MWGIHPWDWDRLTLLQQHDYLTAAQDYDWRSRQNPR